MALITLTDVTPYGVGWLETMAVNIGGDPRRSINLYNSVALGTCDGTYSIWVKKGDDPWLKFGDDIAIAGSTRGHALTDREGLNCFDKLYVSKDVAANAESWFMTTSGNMGY